MVTESAQQEIQSLTMKAVASVYFLLTIAGFAGETGVTYSYQVLSGLGEGGARLEKVYCADYYASSGMPTAFQLITAPNIPPTNSPQPVDDVNLASAAGIKIDVSVDKSPLKITINATMLTVPERFDTTPENLLRATLEAVRQTAGLLKTKDYHVEIKARGALEKQAAKLLKAFREHPKSKPFWKAES